MHQNEWFQVWFFKNFLGRGSPSPLPIPLLDRAPSPDPSPALGGGVWGGGSVGFIGLRPRFGLHPQFSGALRPSSTRASPSILGRFAPSILASPLTFDWGPWFALPPKVNSWIRPWSLLHFFPARWVEACYNYTCFQERFPSDKSNYRPIALTCCCCKILESIVVDNLLQFLADHNLITRHQHGFLRCHSTVSNLLESVNDWSLSLSRRSSVDIVYIDFMKAFDSISHPKLIHKLSSYGIHGNLLFWIIAFPV